jgi:hypothetical protein
MSDGFHSPFGTVKEFLDGRNYTYSASEENQRIGLSMCGRHADYRFVLRITNEGEFFQITANYPLRIRDGKLRPSVAELLTRANYAMLLGKFEMDMEDGEIRFHLSQVIEEGRLEVATVEKLFLTCLHTLDRYFPALMQHIHAGYTPGDAVFHAELDIHAEQVVETPPVVGKAAPETPSAPRTPEASETPSTSETEVKQDIPPVTPVDPPAAQETPVTSVPAEAAVSEIAGAPTASDSSEIRQEAAETGDAPPVRQKDGSRKPRRVVRRKLTGPDNHPEFPF